MPDSTFKVTLKEEVPAHVIEAAIITMGGLGSQKPALYISDDEKETTRPVRKDRLHTAIYVTCASDTVAWKAAISLALAFGGTAWAAWT